MPQREASHYALGLAAFEQGNYADALRRARMAYVEEGDGQLKVLPLVVDSFLKLGQREEAKEWLAKNTTYEAKVILVLISNRQKKLGLGDSTSITEI